MPQIVCAIDTSDLEWAKQLVSMLSPHIDLVKLGYEFFFSCGLSGVEEISRFNIPIFLDLKLHDITNTITKSLKILKELPIKMLTVHVLGGSDMLKNAKSTLCGTNISLIGVTLLTSLSTVDLKGFDINIQQTEYVEKLAIFAKNNGLDGVVCSLLEVNSIKKACGEDFITVAPGVTFKDSNSHKRAVSVDQIAQYNSDYIVIGRAITSAQNVVESAKRLSHAVKNSE